MLRSFSFYIRSMTVNIVIETCIVISLNFK